MTLGVPAKQDSAEAGAARRSSPMERREGKWEVSLCCANAGGLRKRREDKWNDGLRKRRRAWGAMQIAVVVGGHLRKRVRRFQLGTSDFRKLEVTRWNMEVEIQVPEGGNWSSNFQTPTSGCWKLESNFQE